MLTNENPGQMNQTLESAGCFLEDESGKIKWELSVIDLGLGTPKYQDILNDNYKTILNNDLNSSVPAVVIAEVDYNNNGIRTGIPHFVLVTGEKYVQNIGCEFMIQDPAGQYQYLYQYEPVLSLREIIK